VGTVDDVAELVRFLAGSESSWITGQCISVDGGQSLRKGADFGPFAEALYREQPEWRLVVEQGKQSAPRPANGADGADGASGSSGVGAGQ
jgi:hypothetical protein